LLFQIHERDLLLPREELTGPCASKNVSGKGIERMLWW